MENRRVAKSRDREPLTRERILSAALAIVDEEGLEAVSMRRVGEALGVEAMSLYNHVANKAAIFDGIFELVLAELPPPKRATTWPSALRDRARAFRAVLRRHPNALPIVATRPPVTPASFVQVEHVLGILRDAGFSAEDALAALHVLFTFVVGHTTAYYAPSRDEGPAPDYAKLDAAAFARVREAASLLPNDAEREFELGLDFMLAGLEARLASAGASAGRRRR